VIQFHSSCFLLDDLEILYFQMVGCFDTWARKRKDKRLFEFDNTVFTTWNCNRRDRWVL